MDIHWSMVVMGVIAVQSTWFPAAHSQDTQQHSSLAEPAEGKDWESVFQKRVSVPNDLDKRQGKLLWKVELRDKASSFDANPPKRTDKPLTYTHQFVESELPRYLAAAPRAGDFALYFCRSTYVNRAFAESFGQVLQSDACLRLEYIQDDLPVQQAKERELRPIRAGLRFHNIKSERVQLATNEIGRLSRQAAPKQAIAGDIASFDGKTLSVNDLTYFRQYLRFVNRRAPKRFGDGTRVDELLWLDLGADKAWGRLQRFTFRGNEFWDPEASDDQLVVSDRVPVRGLLFAKEDWSSSSGLRNSKESVTLINYGRLARAQLQQLASAKEPFPEEIALLKQLSRPKGE